MISSARCFNHSERLAAAKCLVCGNSFCRECATEHDGRFTCATCLRKREAVPARGVSWRGKLAIPAMAATALCGSWLLFYTAGWWLEELTAPDPVFKAAPK